MFIIKTKDTKSKKITLPYGDGSIYFVEKRNRYAGQIQLLIDGERVRKTVYGTCKCESCPNKSLCTKSDKGRTIQRAKVFADFRNKSFENITTPKGIELRMNRSIQVEGAFGVLKQDCGFRRF